MILLVQGKGPAARITHKAERYVANLDYKLCPRNFWGEKNYYVSNQ